MVEGTGALSREAQVPALLDMLGLRYTASDVLTLATCLDKARTKEILAFHRIPTPAFRVFHPSADLDDSAASTLTFPLIVKPLHEGSSKGIFERSLVTSRRELDRQINEVLRQYQQPALVEEFLSGREFTVALMGNGPGVEVLPIVEIMLDHLPPGAKPLYSYEAKWIWDDPAQPIDLLHCPAKVTSALQAEVESICQRAYHALRCRDWGRIDVRLDAAGRAHVLEINPLPGIQPDPDAHSSFPLAARTHGLSYAQLIHRVVDLALKRYATESPPLLPTEGG
jgi:D-alanine-D-alanine ligase